MVWLVGRQAIPCRPTMSVVILARTDSRHQPKVWYGLLAEKPYHVGRQCRLSFWQGLTADTSQKYGMACWLTNHTMSADNVGVILARRTDSQHKPKVWYDFLADKPYHVGQQCQSCVHLCWHPSHTAPRMWPTK